MYQSKEMFEKFISNLDLDNIFIEDKRSLE